MVSDKKIFSCFTLFKSNSKHDPGGRAIYGFRQEDFSIFFPIKPM